MKRPWFIASLLLLAACGSPQRNAETAEVLGTPPSPAEDPFFYLARPPVDAEAERQGTIGDAAKKSKATSSRRNSSNLDGEERAEVATLAEENLKLRSENLKLKSRVDDEAAVASDLRSKNRLLGKELASQKRALSEAREAMGLGPAGPKQAECHACVKLCPLSGRCPDDAELVCGWGSGKSRKAAKLRARAECDGALSSLRKNFSRIEGTCPVAVCD